jgi:hypothetical protein
MILFSNQFYAIKAEINKILSFFLDHVLNNTGAFEWERFKDQISFVVCMRFRKSTVMYSKQHLIPFFCEYCSVLN